MKIEQLENESDYLFQQRVKCLEYLGTKWILHPDNKKEKDEDAKKPILKG